MKYILLIMLLSISTVIYSQETDSVKNYTLNEITVQSALVVEAKSVSELNLKSIQKSDALSLFELSKYIPSVKAQTNSRGESLIFFRGSNERQISLFFDGVPLNIPWDNRIDLSLIPTNAIEKIQITKGSPSAVYGANTPAGVVNVSSKNISHIPSGGKFSFLLGENATQKYSGFYHGKIDTIDFLISASYNKSNGYNLSDKFNHVENPGKLRRNSASNSINLFSKFNYNYGSNNSAQLSFSFIDAEKNVPTEIDVSKPRYWKYPVWQKVNFAFNGVNNFSENNSNILAYTFSFTKFKMQIDEFDDFNYSTIDDIEKDNDLIFYGRTIYTKFLNLHSLLKFIASITSTLHKEEFLADNFNELKYSQNIFSTGAEYEFLGDQFSFNLSGTFDMAAYPRTGDKQSKSSIKDFGLSSYLGYNFSNNFSSRISFGRKTRFPTLRETFSGALGKFVPNPNLSAEIIYSADLNFAYQNNFSKTDFSFFYSITDDGIVKESLPEKQFQRINKDRIRTYGVELSNNIELTKDFSIRSNITYLNSYAKNSNGEFSDTLEYKPEWLAGIYFSYSPITNFESVLEFNYTGVEYGLQGGNVYFQKLADHLLTNIRLSYNIPMNKIEYIQVFVRANNIFDKNHYSQWGLPEAGRQVFVGFNLSI